MKVYEYITVSEYLYNYETNFWGGALQRLELIYKKLGSEGIDLIIDYLEGTGLFDEESEFSQTELNDFIWFDDELNEYIDKLLYGSIEDDE